MVSKGKILEKINWAKKLGLKGEEIVRLFSKNPVLFVLNETPLNEKIDFLKTFGFSIDDIKKILLRFPQVLSMPKEHIEEKLVLLEKLGITKEETIAIVVGCPSLLGSKLSNIEEKFLFLEEVGLKDAVVKHPMFLIQSNSLTRARMNYLSDRPNIKVHKYFMGSQDFRREFGISNEELLQNYDFQIK